MGVGMVTARMSEEKKYDGARILKKLGTTPSKAINNLYDYVIKNRALPFEEENKDQPRKITPEQWREAQEWVDSLRLPYELSGEFKNMTTKEARMHRLMNEDF